MFGYVLPVRAKMAETEFEAYRALYCGACKELQKQYGFISRFLLNYDLVLVSVLADAVSGEEGLLNQSGCFIDPLHKRPMRSRTAGLTLSADGLILLSYGSLRDKIQDAGFWKRLGYRLPQPFLYRLYKRAAKSRPALAAEIEAQTLAQQNLEAAGCTNIEAACEPTARMCAALFREAGQTPKQQELLYRIGLFCGQIVYLLDAAEDYADDARTGSYNVLAGAGLSHQEATETAQLYCRLAAGELARSYQALPLLQYKPILDNIFYLGLPTGIAHAGTKRNRRIPKHGEIQSV